MKTAVAIAAALISTPAAARLTGESFERELTGTGTLVCDGNVPAIYSYINYVMHFTSSSSAMCSDAEATEMRQYALDEFDSCFNADPQVNAYVDSSAGSCGRRRLEMASQEDTESREVPEFIAEKYDEHRRKLVSVLILPGTSSGKCFMCPEENLDQRRELTLDTLTIFQNLRALAEVAEACLTSKFVTKYNSMSGHCAEGKNPEVHVLIKASDNADGCDSSGLFDLHCCVKQNDVTNMCSGYSDWCQANEAQCTQCSGLWVNALEPQFGCLSRWANCFIQSDGYQPSCCGPFHCVYQSIWYAQCKTEEPTAQQLVYAEYHKQLATGTCLPKYAKGNCHQNAPKDASGNPVDPDCCAPFNCVVSNDWYSQCK